MEVERLGLRDEVAVGPQGPFAQRVEARLEQSHRRTDRVGQVDHDHVELTRQLGDRVERVARPHFDARVLERFARDRVVLARDLHDLFVELEEVHALDARVLEDLGDEVDVAATHDRDRARVRVREQRGVGEHLVVHVRVEVGHLHDAVECEHAAEPGRLEQHELLVPRAAPLEHAQHVVARVRRAARLELLEAIGLGVRMHAAREEPAVDALGGERLAQHVDHRVEVDLVSAREEIGGHVVVLGPRVQREMTLGDYHDARHAVRGELVDEHLDQRDPARCGVDDDGLAALGAADNADGTAAGNGRIGGGAARDDQVAAIRDGRGGVGAEYEFDAAGIYRALRKPPRAE